MEQEKNIVNKNNIQMGIIIVLLVIIAVMGFFLGKNSNSNTGTNVNTNTGTGVQSGNYEDLSITVYEDKRCTSCPTNEVIDQLKLLPSIAGVEIVRKDFSDEGVADYLTKNEVKALPLIVFSTNNFDVSKDPVQMDQNNQPAPKVNTYLQALPEGGYTLAIGATFNPFEKRSENGFLLLDKAKLEAIKTSSYVKGSKDAKITWLEFSDLECPFCAKLHNSGTEDELTKKYGADLNIVFNHFPLQFHANAQPGAEILECLGEQKGTDAFYGLIKKAYKDEKSTKDYLIEQSVALGANEADLKKCLDDGKYAQKVKDQMEAGASSFGITGTPGNVLINNETGEYDVISGAYPTSSFEEIIDKLLK
ncbi:MAG: thioredoxin domain-containing protein [Candidatus Gracilibacteria bacterium]|nr:thioredoxin domain-containing protein [Candidatus Gracilibacteria bacterium]